MTSTVIATQDCGRTLEIIRSINENIQRENVRKILIFYKERQFAIGDSCIRLNSLRGIKSFFHNASVSINFCYKQFLVLYAGLLKNDPSVDEISAMNWRDIQFENYDVIFFGSNDEPEFLLFLHEKYGERLERGLFKLGVFSFSELIWHETDNIRIVFPFNYLFLQFSTTNRLMGGLNVIHITPEEKEWADRWYASKGVKENERVFVLLDSSSRRDKLLAITVYFELLTWLLSFPDVKILIFDEKDAGKEEFYKEWLGIENMSRMIFSKKMEFRKDLCLLGSMYVKMVFGPCTGLLHCASAICNYYMAQGMKRDDLPLLITYTGIYREEEQYAAFWWGNSPLVDCLMLKNRYFGVSMVSLAELKEEDKKANDSLPCREYTADMLRSFVQRKLQMQHQ